MKEKLFALLSPRFPWKEHILYLDSVDSTNTYAKVLACSGAPHGTAVIAGQQSNGRGRLGRSFVSPKGGLYMSLLLRPGCPPDKLSHLTCAAAVAACDAIQTVTSLRPGIKWTNDLVWEGKKLAGILTELVTTGNDTSAVIGIGINCNQTPADFPGPLQSIVTSLSTVTKRNWDIAALAAALLEALADMDQQLTGSAEPMLLRYRQDCVTLGKEVSLCCADTVRHGTALDVLPDGALLVRLENGTLEAVNTGEVSVRGMYGYV